MTFPHARRGVATSCECRTGGRRRSIELVRPIVFVMVLAVVWAACTGKAVPDAEGWLEVGSISSIEEAGVTFVENANVFVVTEDGSVIGLVGSAQHLDDDPVWYCASSDGFEGPFHGELFDRTGRYRGGPGSRDMDRVEIRIESDVVLVNPSRVIESAGRSEDALPATGPHCEGPEDPPGFFPTG